MQKNLISFIRKGVANFVLLTTLASSLIFPASAIEVPISSTEVDINGQKMLTEVYETNRALDPQTLIKDDFQRAGFTYTFDKIVKEEAEAQETRDVTHDVQKQSKTDNLSENIKLFESSIPYIDKDGFEGTLYLDVDSITTTADGYTNKSRNVSTTKTYTGLQYNDPTLIPTTVDKDGQKLNLENVTWNENTTVENGSIPSTYTATATYSKTNSVKVATGYTITAKYVGTASLDKNAGVTYTISYLGTMLPAEQSEEEKPEADSEDNKKEETSKINISLDTTTLFIILILVLIVIMSVLMLYTMKTMKQIAPQAWQMQQQPPQLLPPPNHTMNQNMNGFDQDPYDGTPRQQ